MDDTNLKASPAAAEPSLLYGEARPEFVTAECLADLFEATAARLPHKAALLEGARSLSYGELNQLADRIAAGLMAAGVGPGAIVGLWLPRGIDLLVAQLAIAKTGAAWLPFDSETPVDRIRLCLDDAQAIGLLTAQSNQALLGELTIPRWFAEDIAQTAEPRHRAPVAPDHPAYAIYTSGSTGKPKGIRIDQGAICHFLRAENARLGIREDDRVYQGFSVAFDMSFEEIWISYLVGATLWLAPREIASDPDALPDALATHGITVLHAVPTLVALFSRDVPTLRLLNLGGEACPEALVARWARPGRQVFNSYGPTEAAVTASLIELQPGEPITIGRPLPNYGLMVIDPAVENGLRLLPRGETGELCITGPGIAPGYLGRPELTADKFRLNPWAQGSHDTRLYRTGDLARITADGRIECLGRTDDQVKIRGFRVELGEIEATLMRQPGVGTAAVLLRQDEGIERLTAYLVTEGTEGTAPPDAAALRSALAETLPPYMVPVHLESLPEMPRLTSGKIDRHALRRRPLVLAAGAGAESEVAESPAEAVLFAELEKLFPGQAIRRDADFFSDLGGHSLFAARLASALRAHPAYAGFTVRDIYQRRRIGAIAETLETTQRTPTEHNTAWAPPPGWKRWACGLAQAAAIPGLVALRMAQWLAPFFAYHFYTGDPGDSIPRAVVISIGVFLLTIVAEFVIAAAGKWLILGRIKPGRYPLWGITYFRWWLADRLIEGAPVYMLSGSPLYVRWLRLLGCPHRRRRADRLRHPARP